MYRSSIISQIKAPFFSHTTVLLIKFKQSGKDQLLTSKQWNEREGAVLVGRFFEKRRLQTEVQNLCRLEI